MEKETLKKALAGLCLTGLIAGSSIGVYQAAAHASSG
jgi:radical SAM modification target selenobiotic family peptide